MSTTLPTQSPSHLRVVLLAGLVAGACDITAAFLHAGIRSGVSPPRVLRFVASGALGDAAFTGGYSAAAIGLGCHFLIALIWAAIYYAASRRLKILVEQPVICGMLYGIFVHKMMQLVVVPLSRAPELPPDTTWWNPLIRYLIHMFCVGLPIALMVARAARRQRAAPAG